VYYHTHIASYRRWGARSVGSLRVWLLALDGRDAEVAGGLSSEPILFGLRRTMVCSILLPTIGLLQDAGDIHKINNKYTSKCHQICLHIMFPLSVIAGRSSVSIQYLTFKKICVSKFIISLMGVGTMGKCNFVHH
jgi:hypothetical protein